MASEPQNPEVQVIRFTFQARESQWSRRLQSARQMVSQTALSVSQGVLPQHVLAENLLVRIEFTLADLMRTGWHVGAFGVSPYRNKNTMPLVTMILHPERGKNQALSQETKEAFTFFAKHLWVLTSRYVMVPGGVEFHMRFTQVEPGRQTTETPTRLVMRDGFCRTADEESATNMA